MALVNINEGRIFHGTRPTLVCSLGFIQLTSIRYIHPNDPTNDLTEHYFHQVENLRTY